MGAFGYLLYLAFIFLPGMGLGELLSIWKEDGKLVDQIAYSFALGLCVDTTVLAVRTAGVTSLLKGLDVWTVGGTIAFGLGALLVSGLLRKKISWWVRPDKLDLAFLAILLIQGLMVLLYFQKYPIFPEYESQDYIVHVQNTLALISGTYTTIPSGVLYNGIYFQLAPSLLLVGGSPLVTVRWTMALLTILSTLLFYLAAQKLFSSRTSGVIVGVVYALSGTIWFGSVYNSGLYPNFFGIMASLFLIVAFLDVGLFPRSVGSWTVLVIAVITAYFSHYSTITVLPAVILFPFIDYLVRKRLNRPLLVGAGLAVLPGIVGVLAYPSVVSKFIGLTTAVAGISGTTFLSGLLSSVPVLSYMALEVTYDLGFGVLVILVLFYLWRSATLKSPSLAIPIVWFVTLLIVSPFNVGAWRFSYEALVPFTLMASFAIFLLLPKVEPRRRRRPRSSSAYWKVGLVLVIILVSVLAGSWGSMLVSDAATNTGLFAQNQSYVNESIFWLGANTPQNSSYVSVSDWRFVYTSLLISRETTYSFVSEPSTALKLAAQVNAQFIIVTNQVTESVPPVPSLFPWNNFPTESNSNLTLVYQNPDVRIYKIL